MSRYSFRIWFVLYAVFKVRTCRAPFRAPANEDGEIRTPDLLPARQVLFQLSYTPMYSGARLFSHAVTGIVPSAAQGLTVVFGMGTGVSPARIGTGK